MNNCKQIFKYLAPNVWWICLCLQLAAWILSGWDIYTGIYRVSSPFSLGKGQWAILTLFLWIFWYTLLLFVSERKRFFLIFLCACGMELNLLMFVRALQEGMTQFYLSDLFYSGIADCLYFYFGDSVLKARLWQGAYVSGMQILENILLIYCLYLVFHGTFVFMERLRRQTEKDDEMVNFAFIGRKFLQMIRRQLFFVCICTQIFVEPVPYLDEAMNLHLYPSGMDETGWAGGILIFIWMILLSMLSFRKSLILVFLCAAGLAMMNDYPRDGIFRYPEDEAEADIVYFPIRELLNNCADGLLQYCHEKLAAIFCSFGDIYEPLYSIVFVFFALCFVLICIKLLCAVLSRIADLYFKK